MMYRSSKYILFFVGLGVFAPTSRLPTEALTFRELAGTAILASVLLDSLLYLVRIRDTKFQVLLGFVVYPLFILSLLAGLFQSSFFEFLQGDHVEYFGHRGLLVILSILLVVIPPFCAVVNIHHLVLLARDRRADQKAKEAGGKRQLGSRQPGSGTELGVNG